MGEDDGYGGELPARLTVTLKLPDMAPTLDKTEYYQIKSDEIQIWIGGSSKEFKRSPTSRPEKFMGFEPRIDPESYTNARDNAKFFTYSNIKFFEPTGDKPYGLTHYKSITPVRSSSSYDGKDIYVHEENSTKDDFVLSCKYSDSNVCGCISNAKKLFGNVSYGYCYSQDYLPKAIEIDQKVENIVQSFFLIPAANNQEK